MVHLNKLIHGSFYPLVLRTNNSLGIRTIVPRLKSFSLSLAGDFFQI